MENQFDEPTCRLICEMNPSCVCIDYNNMDKTCFLGTQPNPPLLVNTAVNHWNLVRVCVAASSTVSTNALSTSIGSHGIGPTSTGSTTTANPTTEATECLPKWTQYRGMNSLNGVRITQIHDTYDCLNACELAGSCAGVDLDLTNQSDVQCWFHFSQSEFSQVYTTVNRTQFRFERCPTGLASVDWPTVGLSVGLLVSGLINIILIILVVCLTCKCCSRCKQKQLLKKLCKSIKALHSHWNV